MNPIRVVSTINTANSNNKLSHDKAKSVNNVVRSNVLPTGASASVITAHRRSLNIASNAIADGTAGTQEELQEFEFAVADLDENELNCLLVQHHKQQSIGNTFHL